MNIFAHARKFSCKVVFMSVVLTAAVVVSALLVSEWQDASIGAQQVTEAVKAWQDEDLPASVAWKVQEWLALQEWLDALRPNPPLDPLESCGVEDVGWWGLLLRPQETQQLLTCLEEKVGQAKAELDLFKAQLWHVVFGVVSGVVVPLALLAYVLLYMCFVRDEVEAGTPERQEFETPAPGVTGPAQEDEAAPPGKVEEGLHLKADAVQVDLDSSSKGVTPPPEEPPCSQQEAQAEAEAARQGDGVTEEENLPANTTTTKKKKKKKTSAPAEEEQVGAGVKEDAACGKDSAPVQKDVAPVKRDAAPVIKQDASPGVKNVSAPAKKDATPVKQDPAKPVAAGVAPQEKGKAAAALRKAAPAQGGQGSVRHSWQEETQQVLLAVPPARRQHVIGPRGATVQQLREAFPGVSVAVPPPQDRASQHVVLAGPSSKVAAAAKSLAATLQAVDKEIRAAAEKRRGNVARVQLAVAPEMRRHVVGAGGQELLLLGQQYPGVAVSVPGPTNKQTAHVTIRGPPEDVASVEAHLKAILQAAEEQRQLLSNIKSVKLAVAPDMRRLVVGAGGEELFMLGQKYPSVAVSVPRPSDKKTAHVTISGPPDDVASVKAHLKALLKAADVQRQQLDQRRKLPPGAPPIK